MKKDFLKHRP